MKSHDKKRKGRKQNNPQAATSSTRVQKASRKIPRALLAPSPFTLDRMLAILHALVPHRVDRSADLGTQVATLVSLRLLVRAGGAASSDPLEPGGKWRVNCGWEYVLALGRSVGVDMREWVAGGMY